MLIIFDVVIFAYGVYTIYSAINMKRTQQLSKFFIGGNTMVPIRDVQGYIDAIYHKSLVLGAMAVLFGAVAAINDFVTPLPMVMKALILLFLTVLVWFTVMVSRAKRKFW